MTAAFVAALAVFLAAMAIPMVTIVRQGHADERYRARMRLEHEEHRVLPERSKLEWNHTHCDYCRFNFKPKQTA